jgi:hypothetical protein
MPKNDEIAQMDVKEAFYALLTYMDEADERDENGDLIFPDIIETYEKARYGIVKKFDIYDYINGTMQLKSKTGKALYRGKAIPLGDMWTELEKRSVILKKWLRQNEPDIFGVESYDLQ